MMKLEDTLIALKDVMAKWEYPIQDPIPKSFIESMIDRKDTANTSPVLEALVDELNVLFANQPDYLKFLEIMDGFEYDGVTLLSLATPEPVVKNLFILNEYYRNNDDFIDPDISDKLVLGEDSISLFTYNSSTNKFEIRDNIATENVFESFNNFRDFINGILASVM